MAVGEWHTLNGYQFQETLHGPNVERVCAECAGHCYATPDFTHPRCETCSMEFRGVMRPADRLSLQEKPRRPRLGPGLSGDINSAKRKSRDG